MTEDQNSFILKVGPPVLNADLLPAVCSTECLVHSFKRDTNKEYNTDNTNVSHLLLLLDKRKVYN